MFLNTSRGLSSKNYEYAGMALMLLALWLTTATYSHFSQDSWSYYELSRHVFGDFYRINTWRQFHLIDPYGASFPPLWPVMIAGFNLMADVGIYAGFVMNFGVALFTFYLLRRLAFALGHSKTLGSLWMLGLMVIPDYTTALFSAGTLPLMLVFTLLILLVLTERKTLEVFDSALLGILAGVGVMLRFDYMPCAAALLLAPLWMGRPRALAGAAYLGALLATISPWVAYSLNHFDVWFVSDNSRTLFSAIPIFVRDYYPEGVPLLWQEPGAWLIKTIRAKLVSADVMASSVGMLGFTLLLLAALFQWRKVKVMPRPLWIYAAMVVARLSLILVTGFVESRYYVPLQLFLMISLSHLLFKGGKLPTHTSLIFLGIAFIYSTAYITKSLANEHPISYGFNEQNRKPLEFDSLINNCLGTIPEVTRILLPPKNYSYKFGALTGITSYVAPTNLDAENLPQFQKQFRPTHILTDIPSELGLTQKPSCKLEGWGEVKHPFYLIRISRPR